MIYSILNATRNTIYFVSLSQENDKIEAITFNYDRLPEKEQDLPLIATSMKNLRYIESRVKQANPLFNNFPPKDLCCLILHEGLQQKLWEGCKVIFVDLTDR